MDLGRNKKVSRLTVDELLGEAQQIVFREKPEQYGSHYGEHTLEQYRLYVEMTDRISSRRHTTNAFFLSINTALIALVGLAANSSLIRSPHFWGIVVSATGLIICFAWYRLIRSYKRINTGRFSVIHAIESQLPISPYRAEWELLKKGEEPKHYRPFTDIEVWVPWVFMLPYFTLIGCCIYRFFSN